jgi:hypothetical protein
VKTITNKSRKPLKVPLPGGRFLHLGPLKSGQIADGAADAPAMKRLIKSGEIEILDEGAESSGAGARGRSGSGKASSHGHTPTKMVRSSGDR